MRSSRPVFWAERAADAALLLLAVWQAWSTLVIRVGGSFWVLLVGVPFVLAGAAAVWKWLPWAGEPKNEAEAGSDSAPWVPSVVTAVLSVGAIAAWYAAMVPYHVAWAAIVVHLGVAAWHGRSGVDPSGPVDHRRFEVALVAAAVLSVAATLCVVRPDGDDGYYLGQVTGTLANPELPVLSFDVMHGDLTAPVQQPGHRAQTYELLVAVVSWCLPFLGPTNVYYVIFPVLTATLFALASGLLAREIVGVRAASPAVLATVVLAFVWGGTWITPANFALSRLFQGKSVFVCVLVPLLVLAALRFARAPGWSTWLRLLAAMLGSAALTSTALVVAPIAGAVAVLAALPVREPRRMALVAFGGLASALPCVLTLMLVKLDMANFDSDLNGKIKHLWDVLGPDLRAPLALGAFVALPLLLRGAPRGAWMGRYLLCVFLLVFNQGTSLLLAELGGALFSWRTYWAVPTLVILGAGVGSLALPGPGRWLRAALCGGWLLAFSVAGPWIGSKDNAALGYHLPTWDMEEHERVLADRAVEMTGPDETALLHHDIAIRTTRHIERPKLIGVRRIYVAHLRRHFGGRETRARLDLMGLTSVSIKSRRVPWAIAEMNRRCITALGAHVNIHKRYKGIGDDLIAQGWYLDRAVGRYELWLRDGCPSGG